MSTLHIEMFSPSLFRPTDFYMLIPSDLPEMMVKENPHYSRPMKTLFLLHGYTGKNRDWLMNSPIADLSAKYNLAVILPSGENSFYIDAKATGHQFNSLISKDILGYVRNVFHLALEPDNTFIGGLSMGGFGALHIGLTHSEAFSKIIALSSALIVPTVAEMKNKDTHGAMANYEYYYEIFGEPSEVLASDFNPKTMVERRTANGEKVPDIFMACGTEDFLLPPNRDLSSFLLEKKVNITYREAPGIHDWKFWSSQIEPAVKWALNAE